MSALTVITPERREQPTVIGVEWRESRLHDPAGYARLLEILFARRPESDVVKANMADAAM